MRVQEELVRRRVVKTSANGKKRSYSCNHCFSQIIICGDCGEMFRRIHWNNRGCKSIVWRCISKLEPTGLECHARTINELDLQEIVLIALNELLGDKSKYQKQLQQNIASVIKASAAITTDGIDEKLMELQQDIVFDQAEDRIGEELLVMIEGKVADENAYVGRTYRDAPNVDGLIFVNTSEELMSGDFAKVKVTGSADYDLIGELL